VKNFWLGFAAAIVVLPVSALFYFWLGLANMQANVPPPWWERGLMTTAVHISVARHAEGKKPETSGVVDEDQLVAGGKLYMNGCAGCHGELGKPFQEDRSLYPRVPQLPHAGTQYTEPQIYWIVKHGIRMTAFVGLRAVLFREGTLVDCSVCSRDSKPPARRAGTNPSEIPERKTLKVMT
jgi:mono/diheme cytochrome c family protein